MNWLEETPILSDEMLDALGEFYQNNDVPVDFIMFCKVPRLFGFNAVLSGAAIRRVRV